LARDLHNSKPNCCFQLLEGLRGECASHVAVSFFATNMLGLSIEKASKNQRVDRELTLRNTCDMDA
jgi:hypothetical protein